MLTTLTIILQWVVFVYYLRSKEAVIGKLNPD